VQTIEQLAVFPPFVEAESCLFSSDYTFREPPSAPPALVPRILGAVSSVIRYSSVIREFDLRGLSLYFAP